MKESDKFNIMYCVHFEKTDYNKITVILTPPLCSKYTMFADFKRPTTAFYLDAFQKFKIPSYQKLRKFTKAMDSIVLFLCLLFILNEVHISTI